MEKINGEYNGVRLLLQRSGSQQSSNLQYFIKRNLHSTSICNQKIPQKPRGDKKSDDDEDNKISSLLAKAFLWMLTAYMVIAIISLLFPSSNQPEVCLL